MLKQNTTLLQNWLETVVTAPGYLPHKIQKAQQLYHFNENEIISNEGKASVLDRLNVYSSGYLLRLLDCMAADYPILRKFVGEAVFDSFARAYLHYHPSTSFTLYDLGKSFPEFLAQTKPQEIPGEGVLNNEFLDLPIALAKLERARQEAMRAAGTEERHSDAHDIGMEELLFPSMNIVVPPCFQLLELTFPMKHFFEALYRDEADDLPQPAKTFMAVSRKNYRIMTEELMEWQYIFLKACATPIDMHLAIASTAATCQIPSATLLADVYLWLPIFQSNGFICFVELG